MNALPTQHPVAEEQHSEPITATVRLAKLKPSTAPSPSEVAMKPPTIASAMASTMLMKKPHRQAW